jgi:hypothetical protein
VKCVNKGNTVESCCNIFKYYLKLTTVSLPTALAALLNAMIHCPLKFNDFLPFKIYPRQSQAA